MNIEMVLGQVHMERERQDKKWGEQNHDHYKWVAIIGEEFGEMCQALLEGRYASMEKEAIQVAACCVAMIESVHRQGLIDD
jgi:NTP pyrophosphatase (non-canonical NTP hydrolase)